MKSSIRSMASVFVLGGAALLGGCVAYPAGTYDSGYGYGYGGYGDPYYANPVVVSPSVYVQGGRYYDDRPRYYGRPGYDRRPDPRPGYDARPPRRDDPPRGGGRPSRPADQRPGFQAPGNQGVNSALPQVPRNAPPVVQPSGQYNSP